MPSRCLSALRARLPFLLFILGLSFPAIGSGQSQSLADASRVAGWRSDISYYLEKVLADTRTKR